MTVAPARPAVAGGSRVRLHPLQSRRAGDEVIVGRLATGDFAAVPAVGLAVIECLGRGLTVAETRKAVLAETGEDVDVGDFVDGLAALGFVSDVDGVALPGPAPRRPTFPWITQRRAAWSLSPLVPVAMGAVIAAAAVAAAAQPRLIPGYRSLLWSRHGSLVLLVTVGAGWSMVLLHELAHLLAARATGVPARIELGTRLQFLVAQTDMSGIELAPRRHRLTAYLAGMAVNLTTAAAGLLAAAAAGPGSPALRPLEILVLVAVLPLPFQFMVFMRTDVYFVLQDLTGCPDLFGDGRAYARFLVRRALPGRRSRAADPSRGMSAARRRAVRAYGAVLVLGTVLCLGSLASVTAPADLTVLVRAARRTLPGHSVADRLDGLAVLLVLGGAQAVWARTKWRGAKARRRPGAVRDS
ncbi:hypothetical protein [Streptomyces sp. NPDC049040]|uniref:hypothetical protein n=1 Tax=Streptomyces sp. NPDC049040 TaxID=3365593 RepID=UPI00371567CC